MNDWWSLEITLQLSLLQQNQPSRPHPSYARLLTEFENLLNPNGYNLYIVCVRIDVGRVDVEMMVVVALSDRLIVGQLWKDGYAGGTTQEYIDKKTYKFYPSLHLRIFYMIISRNQWLENLFHAVHEHLSESKTLRSDLYITECISVYVGAKAVDDKERNLWRHIGTIHLIWYIRCNLLVMWKLYYNKSITPVIGAQSNPHKYEQITKQEDATVYNKHGCKWCSWSKLWNK